MRRERIGKETEERVRTGRKGKGKKKA